MSMDYKSSVYSYRRDPTGRRNECRTSYGRMNEWQRDEEIARAALLESHIAPNCPPDLLGTREMTDLFQTKKPKNVVEVMQARDDLRPVADRPTVESKVNCNCLPGESYDHLLGPSCYSYSAYNLKPQHQKMASVLISPQRMRRKCSASKRDIDDSWWSQSSGLLPVNERSRHPPGSLEAAILAGIDVPPKPKEYVTRSEVIALERDNWKVVR